MSKRSDTSEATIALQFLVMNLDKLAKLSCALKYCLNLILGYISYENQRIFGEQMEKSLLLSVQ